MYTTSDGVRHQAFLRGDEAPLESSYGVRDSQEELMKMVRQNQDALGTDLNQVQAQEPTFAEMDRATRYVPMTKRNLQNTIGIYSLLLTRPASLQNKKTGVYENRDDPNFAGPTYTGENTYIPVGYGSKLECTAEQAAELMMQEDKKAILEGRSNEKQRQAEEERVKNCFISQSAYGRANIC